MNFDLRIGRAVPLNALQATAAVLGIRRESTGQPQRWTLGSHGSFEVDNQFVGMASNVTSDTTLGLQRIVTTGRLWSPDGMAVVAVEIAIESAAIPPTQVVLAPTSAIAPTFANAPDLFRSLAFAAIEEFCEDLLFHAAAPVH